MARKCLKTCKKKTGFEMDNTTTTNNNNHLKKIASMDYKWKK